MLTRVFILLTISSALFTTGCLRSYTMLRIERNGTGTITDTLLFSPRLVGMLESMNSMGDTTGSPASANALEFWNDSTITADASRYGQGTTVRSITPLELNGYKGYVAVFDIPDISLLTLEKDRAASRMASTGEEMGQAGSSTQQPVTFSYDRSAGRLEITNVVGEPEGIQDTIINDPPKSLEEQRESLDMMSGFLRGMHVRIAVSVEPGISNTNAHHVHGNVITLMEMDFDKLIRYWDEHIESFQVFDGLKEGKTDVLEAELAKYPPGALLIETQPKIIVDVQP